MLQPAERFVVADGEASKAPTKPAEHLAFRAAWVIRHRLQQIAAATDALAPARDWLKQPATNGVLVALDGSTTPVSGNDPYRNLDLDFNGWALHDLTGNAEFARGRANSAFPNSR